MTRGTPQRPVAPISLGLRLQRIAFLIILNAVVILQLVPKRETTKAWASMEPTKRVSAVAETPILTIAPDLEVLEANLYAVDSSIKSNPNFTLATVIRPKINTSYGWAIRLRTSRKRIRFNEELRMPGAPTHWGLSKATKISSNGKIAITNKEQEPRKGMIANFWRFSEGDPKGSYEIAVSVEGVLVKRFKFSVQ